MTLTELLEFIESKMSMSHVYQPVLIRALVDAGGTATIRQLCLALVLAAAPALVLAEAVAEPNMAPPPGPAASAAS